MNIPNVSILIPVFNRKDYIAECIQSALDQTFTDFEIVVVDNASDDGTWEICQELAAKDQRVRIFRNDANIGPVRNWLACVALARGGISKILWSDDLIHPDFLSKLLPYLDNPAIGFVYSSADVFEKSAEDARARLYTTIETGIYDSSRYIEGALLGNDFPYSPGCAVFRTADVKQNLLLHVPNRVSSDFSMHAIGNDLLLFLLTAQLYPKFAIVNEPLAYFRAHKGSITTSAPDGKIPLHYDLAKGFFAVHYSRNEGFSKKLNVEFLLHLLRYNSKSYGITTLTDFYPSTTSGGIDFLYFADRIFCAVKKKMGKFLTFFRKIIFQG